MCWVEQGGLLGLFQHAAWERVHTPLRLHVLTQAETVSIRTREVDAASMFLCPFRPVAPCKGGS